VTVTSPPPPPLSASFTFSPSSSQTNQQVTFTAAANGGTTPYMFSWTFGDSSSDIGSTVAHTYTSVGTFTVVLAVTDSGSPQQSAISQQSVTVTNQPAPLTTSFAYSPSSPTVGQNVTFTASASGGTAPYSFRWNFGDGSSGEASTVFHTYTNPGSYNASIMVIDAEGHSTTWSETIETSPLQLVPSFWQQYWYLLAVPIAIGGLSTILVLRNRSRVSGRGKKTDSMGAAAGVQGRGGSF